LAVKYNNEEILFILNTTVICEGCQEKVWRGRPYLASLCNNMTLSFPWFERFKPKVISYGAIDFPRAFGRLNANGCE
jgi:hypothetical protein